jgi:hypothetical protein
MNAIAANFVREKSAIEHERERLAKLAEAHGGPLVLIVKDATGALSAEEREIYKQATVFLQSHGAQFF